MNSFIRSHLHHWEAYVPGKQPKDLKIAPHHRIIKLNTNESPFILSEVSDRLQTLARSRSFHLNRYPDPSAEHLRATAGNILNIPQDHLVFANGSDEIISAIFRAYLGAGDSITLPSPTYGAYAVYSRLYNIKIEELELAADFLLSEENLTGTIGKVVFLPNPHAPSGNALAAKTLLSIIKKFPQKLFVIDEAYIDFNIKETLITEIANHPNLIILRTLSKAAALAGLRVGYAISRPDHIQILRKVLDPYNLNMIAQDLATLPFIHHKKIALLVQKIIAIRDKVTAELTTLGFKTIPSKTNFILTSPQNFTLHPKWTKLRLEKTTPPKNTTDTTNSLPKSLPSSKAQAQLLYSLLTEHQILVRYFPTPRLAPYLRITIGTERDMKRVITVLRSLQKAPKHQ
ncbi:histidinol-phosphate aminotransferase [Spirochaetota bacterium]|nr:histidinol-phosphate aminotransferase [Spirochaetota bacterium]